MALVARLLAHRQQGVACDQALPQFVVDRRKLLGIELLDHLVIGSGGRWVSLRERGLGFGGW